MLVSTTAFALSWAVGTLAVALPLSSSSAGPLVTLDYGTFLGKTAASNGQQVSSFLGVPFARPPINDLRYRLAVIPPFPFVGIQNATAYGPSCTQQNTLSGLAGGIPTSLIDQVEAMPMFQAASSDAEDCLSINIQAPATIPAGSGLPVVVWIYGGGFEFGTTSGYDGAPIVGRSITTGSPVIYVSMNYRLNGFGFMASQEIKDAGVGNIGLDDQRAALRWVQRYISKFGGDPTKVTIWGESAGAISATLQMVTNGGNPAGLFRAVFAQSGSPIPCGPITGGQPYYNQIVGATNCTFARDTLACLRTVPYQKLKAAINQTPGIFAFQSLNLAWRPRVDGVFLTDNPQVLVARGAYAKVPLVTSDCDDEATIFSLSSSNGTLTDAQVGQYIQSNYIKGTDEEIEQLLLLYPQAPALGSPFDTGLLNQLTPQFKRLAAFLGDLVFQAPRRYFLLYASKTQPTWAYIYKRTKATPFLGSYHTTDINQEMYLNEVGGVDFEMIDYFVNFATKLDPNSAINSGLIFWPKWSVSQPNILTFLDRPLGGLLGLAITLDNYRMAAMQYLNVLGLKYPSP